MGKKKHKVRKHQNDPGDNETSDDESQLDCSGKTCSHIIRGVNLSNVKKTLKTKQEPGMCQNCGSRPKDIVNGDDDKESLAGAIWMCLQCGNQGCGRYSPEQHAIQHYQTPRSDCHALAINMSSWDIWCYDCDETVVPEWNKKLVECVDYLKRHSKLTESTLPLNSAASKASTPKVAEKDNIIDEQENDKLRSVAKTESKESLSKSNASVAAATNQKALARTNAVLDSLPKVKGLVNLGNTCFFNSVMQCLTQTHPLGQLLDSECVKNSTTAIAGTFVDLKDKGTGAVLEHKLPPITIALGDSGGMTQAMSLFLKDMHSMGKAKLINPGQLLGQVCKRSPQFRGSQQQDSHELLRHLLDGLKSEETQRYQAGILKIFGLPTKINPNTVEAETKAKVKAYGKLIQQTLVDRIFSGQLISTVLCEECRMSSQVFEPFLDLSLPVTEEKVMRPGLSKKNTNDTCTKSFGKADDSPPSKHQEKKAKKQAKRDAKVQRSKEKQQRRRVVSTDQDAEETNRELSEGAEKPTSPKMATNTSSASVTSSNDKDGSDSEMSDADVEDNAETGSTCSLNTNNESSAPAMVSGKDLANELCTDDGDCGSHRPVNGPSLPRHSSPEESGSPMMDPEELIRKICDLRIRVDDPDGNEEDVADGVTCNSGWGHRNGVADSETTENYGGEEKDEKEETGRSDEEKDGRSEPEIGDDDEDREERKKSTMMRKLEWMKKSLTTLAPRYQPSSHECSVLSCLNQFTASELLTGPNKFGCENCTRLKREKDPHNSSSSEEKKSDTVYTNASKQLLIFNPPAVLTLHLKRFQQAGFRLLKVNRHVEFPILLDLAPFCSLICLGLPTLERGQKQVLYSLFAVVEHSGRLTGGHYTAFVKVRPSAITSSGPPNPFLNKRPASQCDVNRLVEEMHRKVVEQDDETKKLDYSDHPVPGRWYYVSDGHVSDTSEAAVLKCQAYLLFYERIV